MTETYKPKLIEVALPLAAINAAAAREKSIRHGHPSMLHLWWARRPLAATRAVIWSSLVDDPSGDESLSPEEQELERQRLFAILERLVVWENSNDPDVLAEAHAEIDRCYDGDPPPILDPFGGGGAIPLEAQRLGLAALSGDLNPVASLIQRAMLQIPARFDAVSPVHPGAPPELSSWSRAQGLAADVQFYGMRMLEQARGTIGAHYPTVTDPDGKELTPIAYVWARTAASPDPAWNGQVPLVGSWTLAKRKGKEDTWIEPIVDEGRRMVTYEIRQGGEPTVNRTVERGKGTCIATGSAMSGEYIKAESRAGRMAADLIAVVAEGEKGRVYLAPGPHDVDVADVHEPKWEAARPESRKANWRNRLHLRS